MLRGLMLLAAILGSMPGRIVLAEDAAVCARCHEQQSVLAAAGGHAFNVDCLSCHQDRRPGRVGHGHRTIAGCTTHHDVVGHPPHAVARSRRQPSRTCLVCHDPHGSPNLSLVRPAVPPRPHQLKAVTFTTEQGAAPGGFTDPAAPGTGLCEICHRRTDFYRANGGGKPHFVESCVLCHVHDTGFQPVATDANCAICHATEAARFAKANLHSARFACSSCHADNGAPAGVGHRQTRACAECHDNKTHAPPGYAALPCMQCHDPHGTDNVQLILDVLTTTQGASVPIRFDNPYGRVDGSFASASAPGTGICEVCHTTTRFYRADGTGDPHFTVSCFPCHLHANGFNPQ